MRQIRFDNGAVLQIEFSWASNIKEENRFVELRGTKAGLTWRDGNFVEIHSEEDGQLVDIKPASKLQDEGHSRNLRHFVDVLLERATPCFKPQQGVDMIKILAALYKSARTGASGSRILRTRSSSVGIENPTDTPRQVRRISISLVTRGDTMRMTSCPPYMTNCRSVASSNPILLTISLQNRSLQGDSLLLVRTVLKGITVN
ncbi:MAG: Gfo/Idh/MocA family oxidoreductase [bacterium]